MSTPPSDRAKMFVGCFIITSALLWAMILLGVVILVWSRVL